MLLVPLILSSFLILDTAKGYPFCGYETKPFNCFGSKTNYDHVRGNLTDIKTPSGCKPVQIWGFNRHGTRRMKHFEVAKIKLLKELHDEIVKNSKSGNPPKLCPNDLEVFMAWHYNTTLELQKGDLSWQGIHESMDLGKRFKERFPQLFKKSLMDDYYFKHTTEQRTEATCKAFIEGVFGEDAKDVNIQTPHCSDETLRPYFPCPMWQVRVDRNKTLTKSEAMKFKLETPYKNLVLKITQKLGVKTLKEGSLELMYNMCRFETSWHPQNLSPWCALFAPEDFKVMSYLDDLAEFYNNGFGHYYQPKLGCMPLKDMLKRFKKTVETGKASPVAVELFSHHTILNMLLTALNYGNDGEFLTAKNWEKFMEDRRYSNCKHVPFGANLAAVLYQCPNKKHSVQFILNENPMELDDCPNGLCSWETLENMFTKKVEKCNLNFCYDYNS